MALLTVTSASCAFVPSAHQACAGRVIGGSLTGCSLTGCSGSGSGASGPGGIGGMGGIGGRPHPSLSLVRRSPLDSVLPLRPMASPFRCPSNGGGTALPMVYDPTLLQDALLGGGGMHPSAVDFLGSAAASTAQLLASSAAATSANIPTPLFPLPSPETMSSSLDALNANLNAAVNDLSTTASNLIPDLDTLVQPTIDSIEQLTPEMEEMSLGALGHDLLLFLTASVVVEPLGKVLGVTPVLLYLLFGFAAGPCGLSLFVGGTEVDAQIGDFGILFLLFVEGLNLSPERLRALGSFFSLGATQLLLSVGVIFFGFFLGGPLLLPFVSDVRVPIDDQVFALLERPVVAFSIAGAGALSSSAFVLPILKEKGWEKGPDGIAALSILLLQDLAVAPLLVLLPLIADYDKGGGGSMMQDPTALTLLVGKATIGFGGVLAIASQVLRQIFQIVARYGSSQTFVAASLLVACGMGIVADNLGLSATTGAFAAGVLLAESGYRAQIEADIKPFEGILLGVFFTTAGSSLDPATVVEEWPTLLAGIAAFIVIKIGIVFSAGEFAFGLTRAQSTRVALLLAGGGEFAFVVFKLAEDLDILPSSLTKLLTASVIISMSLTPLLGELADFLGREFDEMDRKAIAGDELDDYDINLTDEKRIREAFQTFDEDGSGAISADELQGVLTKPGKADELLSLEEIGAIIARFDDNGDGELQYDEFASLWTAKRRGAIEELGPTEGGGGGGGGSGGNDISNAIVVCGYGEVGQRLCAALEESKRRKPGDGGGGPSYVAFSRNPSRISAGVLNGATVVYGDGASSALVKAAGVEKPACIAVTYVTETKCLEATRRMRDAFPDVPIYVRADRQGRVKTLLDAGATQVVVEKNQVAQSLGNMIGIKQGSITADMLQDSVSALVDSGRSDNNEQDNGGTTGGGGSNLLPYTDNELTELANECGKSKEEMVELFKLFATSFARNEQGEVQLAELRNELMRQSDTPLDDKAVADWMGYDEALSKWVTGEAELQWVSFSDFVRFTARGSDDDDGKVDR